MLCFNWPAPRSDKDGGYASVCAQSFMTSCMNHKVNQIVHLWILIFFVFVFVVVTIFIGTNLSVADSYMRTKVLILINIWIQHFQNDHTHLLTYISICLLYICLCLCVCQCLGLLYWLTGIVCLYRFWFVGGGCSSVGRASDQNVADAGSIPRCGKGFFSRSQLSVQTLLRCPYTTCEQSHAFTSMRTLKIP